MQNTSTLLRDYVVATRTEWVNIGRELERVLASQHTSTHFNERYARLSLAQNKIMVLLATNVLENFGPDIGRIHATTDIVQATSTSGAKTFDEVFAILKARVLARCVPFEAQKISTDLIRLYHSRSIFYAMMALRLQLAPSVSKETRAHMEQHGVHGLVDSTVKRHPELMRLAEQRHAALEEAWLWSMVIVEEGARLDAEKRDAEMEKL